MHSVSQRSDPSGTNSSCSQPGDSFSRAAHGDSSSEMQSEQPGINGITYFGGSVVNSERSSPSQSTSIGPSPNNNNSPTVDTSSWLYPHNASSTSIRTSAHTRQSSSSSSMIGPTSTFYDPDTTSPQQRDNHEAQQYQQWIESYAGQQQQLQMAYQQQHRQHQSSQFGRNHAQAPTQTHNPYNFGQYASSGSLGQYAESASGTATQSNVGGGADVPDDRTSYQQPRQQPQQTNGVYSYYPDVLTDISTSTNANAAGATGNTPDAFRHPYHQQQHSQYSPADLATSYGSDLLNISPSNPHSSHSSLSPTSWTDEVAYSENNSPHNSGSVPTSRTNGNVNYGSGASHASINAGAGTSHSPTATNANQPRPPIKTSPRPSPPVSTNVPNGNQSNNTSPTYINTTPTSVKSSAKRKRARKGPEYPPGPVGTGDISDSDSEDDVGYGAGMGGGISVGMGGLGVENSRGRGVSRL